MDKTQDLSSSTQASRQPAQALGALEWVRAGGPDSETFDHKRSETEVGWDAGITSLMMVAKG